GGLREALEEWKTDRLLADPNVRKELVGLCRKLLCEEVPLFLEAVIEYRTLGPAPGSARQGPRPAP
ncbi:unnamed protein product, partial [Heterosigma akashiwo]